MYAIVKTVHSYWAFLVLIILALAILNAIRGKASGKEFGANDLRISLFGLIFSHIQLLIGLVLYLIRSLSAQDTLYTVGNTIGIVGNLILLATIYGVGL